MAPSTAGVTAVSFTEQMKGFVALGSIDPEDGLAAGRALDQRLMFELTITADDVDRFVADPQHEGRAVGFIDSDLLGGRFDVEQGWFNLFVVGDDPSRRRMLYRMFFQGNGGNPMTFIGHKDVHDDPGFDLWRDTSTLYVRILDGHVSSDQDASAEVLAAGVITIHLPDFMRQLTTFRSTGERPARGMEAFGRLFLGRLWEVYGQKLADTEADR